MVVPTNNYLKLPKTSFSYSGNMRDILSRICPSDGWLSQFLLTQGQFVSNGELTDQPVVECALASILKVANDEIQERKWGRVDYWAPHSSAMGGSLVGNVWETFGEIKKANDDELSWMAKTGQFLGCS